ncbi:unnamed protein product [marine sediment metagenome]|uniref:Uncharacterized protein n=1 Tax=marine sediment metagenome TaxID=412755 RepID=X1BJE0_9ZZZZ
MKAYWNKDQRDFSSVVSIGEIKTWFRQYSNNGPFFSMFETGLDELRFDLIRIDPRRQHVRIFEFKSCRADFLSDKKWKKYLEYCHTFTFVCPQGVIRREEIPPGIGLLYIYKWRWQGTFQPNDRWELDSEWIRRPRKREMSQATLLRLAFMIVSRVRFRKNDMF